MNCPNERPFSPRPSVADHRAPVLQRGARNARTHHMRVRPPLSGDTTIDQSGTGANRTSLLSILIRVRHFSSHRFRRLQVSADNFPYSKKSSRMASTPAAREVPTQIDSTIASLFILQRCFCVDFCFSPSLGVERIKCSFYSVSRKKRYVPTIGHSNVVIREKCFDCLDNT